MNEVPRLSPENAHRADDTENGIDSAQRVYDEDLSIQISEPTEDSSETALSKPDPVDTDDRLATTERQRSKQQWRAAIKQELEEKTQEIVNEKLLPPETYLTETVDPETGEHIPVVDIETLQASFQNSESKDGFRYKGIRVAASKVAKAVFETHKGLECISKEQLEAHDYIPKALFYQPDTVRAATHRLSIRNAEYHLALWDLLHENALDIRNEEYETKDGASLSMLEAKTGSVLFHDYDAQRDDETGQLFLNNHDYNPRDKTSPKTVPLSRNVVRNIGLRQLVEQSGKKSRSIRAGLTEDCPHLLASGALRLDDFREITVNDEGEKLHDFSAKKISSSGYVMIHGVNHYVGRRFVGSKAIPFDGENVLVVDEESGNEVIRGMFTLVDKENASETYTHPQSGNTIRRTNVAGTNLKEIKYDNFFAAKSATVMDEQHQHEIQANIKRAIDQLVSIANQAEQLVIDEIGHSQPEVVLEVRKAMLHNAKDFLLSISQATDSQALDTILEQYSVEAKVFVTMLQQKGAEEMLKNPLEEVPAADLSETDVEQMRKQIYENYLRSYPGEANREFREKVMAGFEEALGRDTTNFYILRDGEKIVSFNRFDAIDDADTGQSVLYFGSFNANPKYRGVGGFMLERTIQEKLTECDAMQAHCDPRMAISQKYIEDGFVATQTDVVARHFSLEIWRSQDVSEQLQTKQMTTEELVALSNTTQDPDRDYFVREVAEDDPFYELDEGLPYVLTRYVTYHGKTYAAFELNSSVSKNFTLPSE